MRRSARGFTLIEMMISIAVLAIITVYMTGLLVQQSRSYEIVDDVAETQQAVRAIGDMLERDVLATGLLARAGGVVSGVDNTGPEVTDVFCVTDPDVVADPTVVGEGRLGISVVGYLGTGPVADTLVLATPSVEQLDNPLNPALPGYDNSGPPDGVMDTDFAFSPGTGLAGGVIVTDPSNPAAGSQCGLIVNVTAGGAPTVRVDWNVRVDGQPLVANPQPVAGLLTSKVAIPAHIYFIRPARAAAAGVAAQSPQLMRDGLALADDVEDLQVAYFHDLNGNGACDANEWSGGDCPAAGVQGFNAYQANATDNCFLRAVRFNFVVRTANQDATAAQNPALAQGAFVQTENAPARAGLDGFRRRAFSRTIRPRNSPINAGSSPRGCS